jgi:hypothetical protein
MIGSDELADLPIRHALRRQHLGNFLPLYRR